MTTINLLPWREQAREKAQRFFFIGLGIRVVTSIVIVISVYLILNDKIAVQKDRNQIIQREITRYDREIREIRKIKTIRQELIVRMKIIQQLQANRPEVVHFFYELTKIVPESVYLTDIIRSNDSVMLIGHADTNSSVSLLMQNIRKNFWVNRPVLEEVQEITDKAKKKLFNQFRVKLLLMPKNKVNNPFMKL